MKETLKLGCEAEKKWLWLFLIGLETVLKNRVTDRVSGSDPVSQWPEAQGDPNDPVTRRPVTRFQCWYIMPYTVRYMCFTIYSFADTRTVLTGVLSFVAILAVDGESGNFPRLFYEIAQRYQQNTRYVPQKQWRNQDFFSGVAVSINSRISIDISRHCHSVL